MENRKLTILASALTLALSGAALVGGSLAWFTDVAVNNSNIIKIGNFDLQLLKYDTETEQYVSAETGGVKLFDSNYKWQPGDMQVAYLAFKNAGDIDLQYTIDVNVYGYNGTTPLENLFEFGLIYSYGINDSYRPFEDWTDSDLNGFADYNKKNTYTQSFVGPVPLVQQKYQMSAADSQLTHLAAGNTHYLALGIHMKDSATLTAGENDLSFNIDFTVRAKQDSEGAEYPTVTSNEELAEALNTIEEGETLVLSPNLTIDQDVTITASDVTIIGNGAKFNIENKKHLVIATDADNVLIDGLEFYADKAAGENNVNRSQAIELQNGTKNVTIQNCRFLAGEGSMSNAIFTNQNSADGKLVIKDNYFERAINLSDINNTVYNAEITGNVFNPGEEVNCITTAGSLNNVLISNNRYEGDYSFWRLYQGTSGGVAGNNGQGEATFTDVTVKDNYLPNLTDIAKPDDGAEEWWNTNKQNITIEGNTLSD